MVIEPVHAQSSTPSPTSSHRSTRRAFCLSCASLLLALAGCAPSRSVPASRIGKVAPSIADPSAVTRASATGTEVGAVGGTSAQTSVTPERLLLDSIDVDIPVVELGWHPAKSSEGQIFSEWDVAEFAAGWHKNSVLPGEPGNVVMSGHNNILGAVFRELDQLRKGDKAVVWSGGKKYVYQVDQILIVPEKYATLEQRKENARWIGDFPDERLTLVSCWPRNDNTHRIIVVAHPTDERQATSR